MAPRHGPPALPVVGWPSAAATTRMSHGTQCRGFMSLGHRPRGCRAVRAAGAGGAASGRLIFKFRHRVDAPASPTARRWRASGAVSSNLIMSSAAAVRAKSPATRAARASGDCCLRRHRRQSRSGPRTGRSALARHPKHDSGARTCRGRMWHHRGCGARPSIATGCGNVEGIRNWPRSGRATASASRPTIVDGSMRRASACLAAVSRPDTPGQW